MPLLRGFMLAALISVSLTAKNNVLLVIFDDLRPSLRCYGDKNAVTPNIDGIAEDGVLFQRAYAQQALCAPSRNSFLTSRRPDTLHLYDFYSYWRTFSGNFTTLPQYFKEHGYVTKSIGKVFHPGVSSNFSDDQPYSWTATPFHPVTDIYKNAEVCWSDDNPFVPRKNVVCPVTLKQQPGGTLPDIESAEEAVHFFKNSSWKQPFFLAVGFHKPHLPLKYPQRFKDFHNINKVILPKCRDKPPSLPDVAWNPWMDLRERHDIQKLNLNFPFESIPEHMTKLILQSYYASVTYVDSLLGQIIDQLRSSGQYENTVIALLGDHGWSLGEHGEWSKFSNYEVATRVPLIIRAPPSTTNMLGPETKDDVVELLDLFPTLSHLAGLPEVPACKGKQKELKLCTEGKNIFHRKSQAPAAFSQYPRPSQYPQLNSDEPKLTEICFMGYSIRTNQYRYTEWVQFQNLTPQWSSVVAAELYDHRTDDDELANVADLKRYSDVRKLLSEKLHSQGFSY